MFFLELLMPMEIEVKLKVEGHEVVRERLREVGAKFLGRVRETNIFFDRVDGALLAGNKGLRVRFTIAPGDVVPKALLTYKGPREATGLRAREAYDLELAPHDQIVPLLQALGYSQILLFEKDRESWQLEGCLVELDTLPVFGTYLEIEGPSEEVVLRVQSRLGLEDFAPVHPGYSEMIARHLSEGTQGIELRFEQQ